MTSTELVLKEAARLLAMRQTNREELGALLAYKAVRRGIRWLNKNAPRGWHRNFFEPLNCGQSFFRVCSDMNTKSAVAVAFEYDDRFIDRNGYVNQYKISQHFGLSSRQQFLLGFNTGWVGIAGQRHVPIEDRINITAKMLDEAWENSIRNLSGGILPYRHQTPEEIARWERVFGEDSSRTKSELEWFSRQVMVMKHTLFD